MDISDRQAIEQIIHSFYSKAMVDREIGYIFTEVAELDLKSHLPRIVDFWESVLFGTGSYKGNPVAKHIALNQKSRLESRHFERWLVLWKETIVQQFEGEIAEEMVEKAELMAKLMLFKINASSNPGFIQ